MPATAVRDVRFPSPTPQQPVGDSAVAHLAHDSVGPLDSGDFIQHVQRRAGQTDQLMDELVGKIAYVLYNVLPNLQNFSLKTQILHGQPNDPPVDVMIPALIIYSIVYALPGFFLSWLLFFRREL